MLALLAVLLQVARPTLVVYNLTVDGRGRETAVLTDGASRATRHLVVALSKDTTVQLVQQSVADQLRSPGPGRARGPGARFAIVGGVRPAGNRVRIVWQLLSVEDLRIVRKDSVETDPGREPEAAVLIARQVAVALAPPGATKGTP